MRRALPAFFTVVLAAGAAACGGGSAPASEQPVTGAASTPAAPVSTDKNAYPVMLNVDEGADPSVPAEQGGKGFTGQGWETNNDFDLIGDPRAVKGGVIREYVRDFPGTLRMEGKPRPVNVLVAFQ